MSIYKSKWLNSFINFDLYFHQGRWRLIILLFLLLSSRSLCAEGTTDTISTSVIADTSGLVRIDKIFIIGNDRTIDKIIKRELTINDGDYLVRAEVDDILEREKNKIRNTRLFLSVHISTIPVDAQTIDIIVRVSERWYTFPFPILEIADRNFNDWWQNYNGDLGRVVYGLKYNQYNVRGRNETLRLTLQLGFTKKFSLSYEFPYINKAQTLGLYFNGKYEENNNVSYQTSEHIRLFQSADRPLQREYSFLAGLRYRKYFYVSHNLRTFYENYRVSDTISSLNPNYFLGDENIQRSLGISYSFEYDKRDFAAYPLEGYYFLGGVSKIGLGVVGNLNQSVLTAKYNNYWDLGNDFYLSGSIGGRVNLPNRQPYNRRIGVGYDPFVIRGYDLYVIEGKSFTTQQATIKRKVFSGKKDLSGIIPLKQFQVLPYQVYLKAFFDSGYIENYAGYVNSTRLADKFLYGTGIGVDIVTYYDTIFRIEQSINAEGETLLIFNLKAEL